MEKEFVEPTSVGTGMATPDEPGALFGTKRREFQILVQSFDKDNALTKQATFTDLKNATAYVEMRERVEGRRCLVWAIEHEPQIVGTMTFSIVAKGEPATSGSSAAGAAPTPLSE